jgi:chorismate dehydratase
LSRVPPREIRTLALDEGSRTSVALTRILLKHKFGIAPLLESLPIGAGVDATSADAVLLIGDRAIHPPSMDFVEAWDLGDQWCRWSELPFVFAMWVARPGADIEGLAEALGSSRDDGIANLEAIARREAPVVRLSDAECLSYLRDNLHFYLGPRERQGLALFRRYAAQFELAPA